MEQEKINKIVKNVLQSETSVYKNKKNQNRIKQLVSRLNPYRLHEFKDDLDFLVNGIQTYLNKSWETIYGNLMEKIQIELSDGKKSKKIGVDIDLPNNVYVGSKSGPNWGNSDQRKSIEKNAKKINEETNGQVFVICAYGSTSKVYDNYTQLAGQKGWEFLTNDSDMYYKIQHAFCENKTILQEFKDKVFGDIKQEAIDFWIKNFYINNKFDEKKHLDYVSKK